MAPFSTSRPSSSTGREPWSTMARWRRWASSSRCSPHSASRSRSTRRAGRWACQAAAHRGAAGAAADRRRLARARRARADARPTSTRVYEVFVPINVAVAAATPTLMPGAAETVAALRERGLKIGSTTGYTRDIMARDPAGRGAPGLQPDCLVCTGDTPDGRPTPFMLYRASSISASGRPGAASRSTTPRSASPRG